MATNRRWKDQSSSEWKEATDWHNVVLWRAEKLADYLTKGKQVYVEGRMSTRSYDKDITEVVADEVILPGSGENPVAPGSQLPHRHKPCCRHRSP